MPASWYQPMGVDAPNGDVDDKGEKAGFKKGAEDRPRYPLLSRSHRALGEGRSISEEAIARRLSGGMVGRRDRGVESLASTRYVIANSVLGQEAPEVHTSAPLHLFTCGWIRQTWRRSISAIAGYIFSLSVDCARPPGRLLRTLCCRRDGGILDDVRSGVGGTAR